MTLNEDNYNEYLSCREIFMYLFEMFFANNTMLYIVKLEIEKEI